VLISRIIHVPSSSLKADGRVPNGDSNIYKLIDTSLHLPEVPSFYGDEPNPRDCRCRLSCVEHANESSERCGDDPDDDTVTDTMLNTGNCDVQQLNEGEYQRSRRSSSGLHCRGASLCDVFTGVSSGEESQRKPPQRRSQCYPPPQNRCLILEYAPITSNLPSYTDSFCDPSLGCDSLQACDVTACAAGVNCREARCSCTVMNYSEGWEWWGWGGIRDEEGFREGWGRDERGMREWRVRDEGGMKKKWGRDETEEGGIREGRGREKGGMR